MPCWRGGRCYVGGVRRHRNGARPAEAYCFVLALDRSGASPRWRVLHRTYVTTEAQSHRRPSQSRDPGCTVVDGGDRIFVATHLGTLAALDPLTGGIEWLVKYRLASGGGRYNDPTFRPGRPVVGADTVSFGPADSDSLYVLDRDSGHLLFGQQGERVDRAAYNTNIPAEQLSGPWRGVLGIRHGRLFVHRDRAIEIFEPEREFVLGRRRLFRPAEKPVRSDDQQVPVQGPEEDPVTPPRIMGRLAFGTNGVALSGGTTLSLLPLRPVTDARSGRVEIQMTGAPIDDLNLDALPAEWNPKPDQGRLGPQLAGACLRVDGWRVPKMCRQELPSGAAGARVRCEAALPEPTAGPTEVVCGRCRPRDPATRVRYLVLVSRDYLTAFELAPPPAGAPGGTHGR